jgi:osmotically-inducible protein OsmY
VLAACWLGSAEESGLDKDIRVAVYEELVTGPLIDADDIVVEVINGDVSLDGTRPSQA